MNGEDIRLTCHEVKLLDKVVADVAEGIVLDLGPKVDLTVLKNAVANLPKGRSRLSFRIETAPFHQAEIELAGHYALTPDARSQLRALPGVLQLTEL